MQVVQFKRNRWLFTNGLYKIDEAINYLSRDKDDKRIRKVLNQLENAKYILERELKKEEKLG